MKDKHFASLARIQEAGIFVHILFTGILGWGLPMFLMMMILFPALGGMSGHPMYLVAMFLVCLVFAFTKGLFFIFLQQKQYWWTLFCGMATFLSGFVLINQPTFFIPPVDYEMKSGAIIWGLAGVLFGVMNWFSGFPLNGSTKES